MKKNLLFIAFLALFFASLIACNDDGTSDEVRKRQFIVQKPKPQNQAAIVGGLVFSLVLIAGIGMHETKKPKTVQ